VGETVEDACRRELMEETGLRGDIVHLLGVYSDPKRDPRGHTVTVAYVLKVSGIVEIAAGDDALEAKWFPLDAPSPLAFDHAKILADARAWLACAGSFERLGDTDFGTCA
jgi:8-oxo-dGTP diphosphatase